ncbi:uncharacterized protein LOC120292814 [Eucalyptus grandis]|uniref:uncharacterized protein LOC120292814 n=1 Tax=Eucalyptus grandis TaxID=71139 RepID=UPI00192F0DBE|nr:uncharacterized protein LOC120292814 [Eucalyptus grandis]
MRYYNFTHSSHQHTLKLNYTEDLFKCDGCKVDDVGLCYSCDECNFDLHFDCAITSKTISHPFFPKFSFQFMLSPPPGLDRRCDACNTSVTGFVYHCQAEGLDLHPCCAKLSKELDNGKEKLYLHKKMSASCDKCETKENSWSYRSCCKGYNLHVACVREMLVESWRDEYVALRKGGGGDDNGTRRGLPIGIPSLEKKVQTPHNRSKSKKKKWCKMARLALQFVISVAMGDPATFIASVFVSLMSGA